MDAAEVLDRQFRSIRRRREADAVATIRKAIPLFSTAEGLVVVTVLVGLLRIVDLCAVGLHKLSLVA